MYLRSVSLAVLFLGAAAGRLGASTSAAARANAWLRQHQDPDAQGLEEFKASDPNGYAIVQALLAKQQTGQLDPSNPTGKRPEAEHESAAEIMRDAPTIEGTHDSMSEIAIQAPVHRAAYHGNPWSFKAGDDESTVNDILGGAPEPAMPVSPKREENSAIDSTSMSVLSILGGGSSDSAQSPTPSSSLISSRRSTQASSSWQASSGSQGNYFGISMDWGKKSAPAAPQHAAYSHGNPFAFKRGDDESTLDGILGTAPTASMSQQNSYVAPAAPVAPAPKPAASMLTQNSYLSQISFPTAGRPAPAQTSVNKGSSDLASFSWDEYAGVADGSVKVRPAQTMYMQQEQVQAVEEKFDESKIKGSLSDWLSPTKPARKPVHQQEQQEEQAEDKVDPMAMDKYNDWAHSGNFQ